MLDISLARRLARRCDGIARRDFLRVGALAPLGLSLPALLSSDAARAAEPAAAASKGPKPRAKSVILVYLGGGLSHHDSFDMKPEAPDEVKGKYKPIDSDVPGTRVGELLPNMSRMMGQVALVRSGSHNNDHHETATNWVLSGRFGSAFGDYPAIGAVVAHEVGFQSALPPYMSIPRNPSFTWELGKSAWLGGRYESFKTGDPNDASFKVQDVAPAEPLSARRVERRQTLLSAVDKLARNVEGNDQITTYDEFHERAATMILSREARSAFEIEQEDPRLRDRYGRTTFGQSCLLARRVIERGVRFATVNFGGWDHHAKIFESLDKKLPEFDNGLATLIGDMQERGLLKDTLVAVFGEFGRTPKINKDAGRDHWASAASMLFAGAGVRGGLVLGATDKDGAYATKRPVSPADVCCTILQSLGINPDKMLVDPSGRPIHILESGSMIRELFA